MKIKLAWPWRATIVIIIAVAVAVIVNLFVIPTSFEATASTESIRICLDRSAELRWHFDSVKLQRNGGGGEETFTGYFLPAPGALVIAERIAKGPLQLEVDAHGGAPNAGKIVRDGTNVEEAVGPEVYFTLDRPAERAANGQTVVLSFKGHADVGPTLGYRLSHETPVLRSCTLRLLGHTYIGEYLFEAGTKALSPGDSLAFDTRQPGVGFVLVGEESALTVVYRIVSRAAIVSRLGSEGYQIKVSLYSRIVGDGSLQLIWAATLGLTWVLNLLSSKLAQRDSGGLRRSDPC